MKDFGMLLPALNQLPKNMLRDEEMKDTNQELEMVALTGGC